MILVVLSSCYYDSCCSIAILDLLGLFNKEQSFEISLDHFNKRNW